MIRTYSELCSLPTFKERYEYLRLQGTIGERTFGGERYLNQAFYASNEWKDIRNEVIIRDNGYDLGMQGYPIAGQILIHHMNPIDSNDILQHSEILVNPEYLICVSINTHNAIHYGDASILVSELIIRSANDTCPWKR